MTRSWIVLGLSILLPACGGSSGLGAVVAPPISAAVRQAAFDALTSRVENMSATATLPSSGSASYTGLIGATASAPGFGVLHVTADTTLDAHFGTQTITGSFGQVISSDGTPVSGSGTFSNGTIGIAGIDADVGGTFSTGGQNYGVKGTIDGFFLGSGANAIGATLNANLRQGGSPVGSLTGEIWAER